MHMLTVEMGRGMSRGIRWEDLPQKTFITSQLRTAEIQGSQAGGTGIEPATCGFGALGALSRLVQGPSSKLPSNSRFLASYRPAASKDVQPLCSQFCSQYISRSSNQFSRKQASTRRSLSV